MIKACNRKVKNFKFIDDVSDKQMVSKRAFCFSGRMMMRESRGRRRRRRRTFKFG